MKTLLRFAQILVFSSIVFPSITAAQLNELGECDAAFIRGDVNGDQVFVPIIDSVALLNFLFVAGAPEPPCLDAADANDDNVVNLIDALRILNFGFVPGTPPIPPPNVLGFDELGISGAAVCNGLDDDEDGIFDDGEGCLYTFELVDDVDNINNDIWAATEHLDGSIIVVGSIFEDNGDMYVQRVSPGGTILWSTPVGGDGTDLGRAVEITDDGRIFAIGSTTSFGAVEISFYVVEMNLDGTVADERVFDIDNTILLDNRRNIVQAKNTDGSFNGFLLTGTVLGTGLGISNYYALRLDPNLDPMWDQFYGVSTPGSFIAAYGAKQTSDLGFLLYGIGTPLIGQGPESGSILKINASGVIDGSNYSFEPTADDGPVFDAVEFQPGVYRALQHGSTIPGLATRNMNQIELTGGIFSLFGTWDATTPDFPPLAILPVNDQIPGMLNYVLYGTARFAQYTESGALSWERVVPFGTFSSSSLDLRDGFVSDDSSLVFGGRFESSTLGTIGQAGYLLRTNTEGLLD